MAATETQGNSQGKSIPPQAAIDCDDIDRDEVHAVRAFYFLCILTEKLWWSAHEFAIRKIRQDTAYTIIFLAHTRLILLLEYVFITLQWSNLVLCPCRRALLNMTLLLEMTSHGGLPVMPETETLGKPSLQMQ